MNTYQETYKQWLNNDYFDQETKNELLKSLYYLCNIDLNIKKGYWDKDTSLYGFLMENCS